MGALTGMESMNAIMEELGVAGGVIQSAVSPQQIFRNALAYEGAGAFLSAARAYENLLASSGECVDVHMCLQGMLRRWEEVPPARDKYLRTIEGRTDPVARFAQAMLLAAEERRSALDALVSDDPYFAPALYQFAAECSRGGGKRPEEKYIEDFLAAAGRGGHGRHFLEPAAASWFRDRAEARLKEISPTAVAKPPAPDTEPPAEQPRGPVTMTAMTSNAGVLIVLRVADADVAEILYRIGGEGQFKSTGLVPAINPRTGRPMPNPTVNIGFPEGGLTIEVKYSDGSGRGRGPFALRYDPGAAAVQEVKQILGLTAGAWVALRDWDDKVLVYFTHLVCYRDGIAEIRWSVDGDGLDRTWPLPPADPKNPRAIPSDSPVYAEVPKGTKFVCVRVTFKDGTESETMKFAR